MEFAKNKTAILMIALFLLSTVAVVVQIPNANATTNYFTSYVYVATGTGDRPSQVNTPILIVAWTADMPTDTGEILGAVTSPSGRAGWYGMQILVTDPDGNTETLDMPYSDPVGANYIQYTPTMVGTYQIQALFPYTDKEVQVDYTSGMSRLYKGDHYIYSAAESPIATFEVVEEPQPQWIESPMVGAPWTRPLNDAARTWYVLTGNWLGGAANTYPPGSAGGNLSPYAYGLAPESAHIIWSKPFYIGGIMDERYGDINFATAHYQGTQFSPSFIVDGKIHWTPYYAHTNAMGWEIIDLYTGQTLYKNYSATKPNRATNYLYESPNQHGGFAYLWETGSSGGFFFGGGGASVEVPEMIRVANTFQNHTGELPIQRGSDRTINRTETPVQLGTVWKMIDAYTLNTVCYLANASTSGTEVYGKDGSILRYNLVGTPVPDTRPTQYAAPWYLTVWNASCGTMVSSQHGTGAWQWRPAGGNFGAELPYFSSTVNHNIVHDGNQMWWQNISLPDVTGGSIQCIREGQYMIVGTGGQNTPETKTNGWMMNISLAENNKGAQIWKSQPITPPFVDTSKNITMQGMFTTGFTMNGVYPEEGPNGIIVYSEAKQLMVWCYDAKTGEELWQTDSGEISQYQFYNSHINVAYGLVIVDGGYTGELLALNATTGEVVWKYDAEGIGDESPYGNYPVGDYVISDGKMYTSSWEHSYTHPIIRGYTLKCINLTDGTEIWSGLDWGTGMAIADGILVESNSLDNMIYAYGKGPSATTVEASPGSSVHGTSVMITGTVTDQTPSGRRNTNDLVDWTLKGTPAISDKDMARWMAYVFMQQIKPTDAKGVEVILETLDPNGNFYEIGNATSDIDGNYGLAFSPDVPGTYQIFATFKGTNSYGPSTASTYLTVDEAPQAAPTPTPVPPSNTDTYVLGIGAGAIIAIIVVGLVIILMLRKR